MNIYPRHKKAYQIFKILTWQCNANYQMVVGGLVGSLRHKTGEENPFESMKIC